MEEYLMTARSVTQAQRMMQALSQHGIRAAMGPLTGGTYRQRLRLRPADAGAAGGGGCRPAARHRACAAAGSTSAMARIQRGGAMIYFDAGPRHYQKPERVRRAMYRAAAAMSSPGRGSYPATRLAEETDFRCRSLAAALFDVEDPACVVFTSSATHGLTSPSKRW